MFDDDDITGSLFFSDNNAEGAFNHLDWSLQPGTGGNGSHEVMISLHEYAHGQLNNTSTYGALMGAAAWLAKVRPAFAKQYEQVLENLIARCKKGHEMYATWFSITTMQSEEEVGNGSIEMLMDNPAYLDYFRAAAALVECIPGKFLKHMVLLSCINFCFQSKSIAQEGEKDLLYFPFNKIRATEFPDQRLDLLTRLFTPEKLKAILDEYLSGEMTGDLPQSGQINYPGYENLSETAVYEFAGSFVRYFQQRLHQAFIILGFDSFLNNEHLGFIAHFFTEMTRLYAPETGNPFTFFIPDVEDWCRNMAIQFESETVIFHSQPLPCRIIQPAAVDMAYWSNPSHTGNHRPYLVLWGRHLISLQGQYTFTNEADKAFVESTNGAVTFIRMIQDTETGQQVTLVPFDNRETLLGFIRHLPAATMLIGAITASASSDVVWQQEWYDFLSEDLYACIFVNDISLILMAEDYLASKADVQYDHFVVKYKEVYYGFVCFQYLEGEGTRSTVISPCSDAFFGYLDYYINKEMPAYVYNKELAKKDYARFEALALDMVAGEYRFDYRNASLAAKNIHS
jgi:hypothetical protein